MRALQLLLLLLYRLCLTAVHWRRCPQFMAAAVGEGAAGEISGVLGVTVKADSNAWAGLAAGTYQVVVGGGATPAQLMGTVMVSGGSIADSFRVSFFRKSMTLNSTNTAGTDGPGGGGSNVQPIVIRTVKSKNADGYIAGIVILAIISTFVIVVLVSVLLRGNPFAKTPGSTPVAWKAGTIPYVENPAHAK
jgi:hypothetical protein